MTRGATTNARPALRQLQVRKLRALLREIVPRNRFWARKFAEAGLDPAGIRGLDDLERLPPTTKDDLQADQESAPPFGTIHTWPPERYVRLHQTSGTTGQPIRWLDTAESWASLLDCWQVIYDAAGVTPADRFFFPFSFGPFVGFWAAFEGAVRRGNLSIPGGGLSSAARLRWIVEQEVTVIACTPTYALRLAEVAGEEGVDLAASKVRALIVAGEPGGSIPSVRRRIEEVWGARCLDHWGMTEVGPLGFEPLERPGGMHLIETHCIAEVIDPESGRTLHEPGRGELVITTLERAGSPLLRYRTGDLVEYCPEEEDGPPHADVAPLSAEDVHPLTGAPFVRFDAGILGRADEMVLVRGNNIYPAAIDSVARLFPEVAEYQAEVLETEIGNRLRVRVELAGEASDGAAAFCARFARAFQDRFFFRPEVELAPPGSLPRYELKARRFSVKRAHGT